MIGQGFIDLHTHGISRYDTRAAMPEYILKMAELHGKAGTNAILPTIYPASIEKMRMDMGAVKKAMEVQKSNPPLPPFAKGGRGGINHSSLITRHSSLITRHSSLILGVHLEGPFLSPVKSGALDRKSFIKPSISVLKKLISGYENIIKIITIAPEIPGALKVIEMCSALGIKVNMGHTDATYKQALDGKNAGAAGITHIFNAMKPFHHREPGVAGLGLTDEDLYIEVIADAIHLHPGTLELIFSVKRLDRIILVSDSVKDYKKKKKAVCKIDAILCGSSITLSDSFTVLKKINIPDAEIIEAGRDNPARYIGLML